MIVEAGNYARDNCWTSLMLIVASWKFLVWLTGFAVVAVHESESGTRQKFSLLQHLVCYRR